MTICCVQGNQFWDIFNMAPQRVPKRMEESVTHSRNQLNNMFLGFLFLLLCATCPNLPTVSLEIPFQNNHLEMIYSFWEDPDKDDTLNEADKNNIL